MAFDGFTIHSINYELYNTLLSSRITKITQPNKDQIVLITKNNSETRRLLISVNSSYPFLSFIDENRQAPKVAKTFCMVLRKHLQNGKITNIFQPNFERIITFEVEHYNEMLDLKKYYLVCEFMGKHSNIILVDENDVIIDSIKRIPHSVSSVREVLPGQKYFVPNTDNKLSPIDVLKEDFFARIFSSTFYIQKAIYTTFNGFSPQIAEEVCNRANVPQDRASSSLSSIEKEKIYLSFCDVLGEVLSYKYFFATYDDLEKKEFASIKLKNRIYSKTYESASHMLFDFYEKKEANARLKQRSGDLRKLISNFLERAKKKSAILEDDILKTKNMDKFNLYGELLKAYSYLIKPNVESVEVNNYYDNDKKISIPLKKELNAIENSNYYYKKYNKLKRTYTKATDHLLETKEEIAYLSSIYHSLLISSCDDDLISIRKELEDANYLHKKSNEAKNKNLKSSPLHFLTSSGKSVYVGKNNAQNEYITFKLASSNDWFFHVKDATGSHVILKADTPLLDADYEEAAALAAFFSSVNNQRKIEVDYVQKNAVKKPANYKMGMVIYNTNYSLIADMECEYLKKLDL